jgi:GT2 family glycosyltransferase
MKNNISITFACYNSVEYSIKCIESIGKYGPDYTDLVVVNNGSTDSTRSFIESIPGITLINNKKNLGCGVAWNQGILAKQSEWTIIMNNDVIVSNLWVESLINSAIQNRLKIVSPALIEGPLNYDFDSFISIDAPRVKNVLRLNKAHAVCLAVHESVWTDIGFFQAKPSLWGFEDTLFFRAAEKSSIPMGITGASWLHHFGSITQSEMKRERRLSEKDGLSDRYNYKLLNESWIERKTRQFQSKQLSKKYRNNEVAKFGMSLHGIRKIDHFEWL